MEKEIETQKLNKRLEKLVKDLAITSFIVFIFLSWFESNDPGSITNYFSQNIFLILTCISTLLYIILYKPHTKITSKTKLAFSAWIIIVLITISSILFYLITEKDINKLLFPLIFCSIVTLFLLFVLFRKQPQLTIINKKVFKVTWLLLSIITIWGGITIFHDLGKNDIFHDEKWHVQVIESLKNKQGFQKRNFLSDESEGVYRRGRILNATEYLITKIFGQNSFTLRIVPATMGVLLIPLIFLVFRNFIGTIPALLTSIGFAFNIPAIFLARFLRPYTTFLFFYLISFYLSYKLIQEVKIKINSKKNILLLALLLISIICTAQANQTGKILVALIPLSWLFSIATDKKLRSMLKKKIKIVSFLFLFLLLLLILFEALNITNFNLIFKQASQYLSIENLTNPEESYYEYIFSKYIKTDFLMYSVFILGSILMIWKVIARKSFESFHFISFALVPFFLILYLLSRYEDFRYIYFLTPFIYGVSMFGFFAITRVLFLNISPRIKENSFVWINSLLVMIFIFYPVIPSGNILGITKKFPSLWSDEEGKDELHRRAVAPEYQKAFSFVNNAQKSGDFVVIMDGEYYLKKIDEVEYFFADRKTRFVEKASNKNEIDFFELVSTNNKLYFVVTYAHLLDKEILNYLLNECQNRSEILGIKKYNYTGYYSKRNLHWPNVFVCNY